MEDKDLTALVEKYKGDEAAIAILSVLQRVKPEYMWKAGIIALARYYEQCEGIEFRTDNCMIGLLNDRLVEARMKIPQDEMREIKQKLVKRGKIAEEALPLEIYRHGCQARGPVGYRLAQ